MTDRELLELAAKAAKIPRLHFNGAVWCIGGDNDSDGYPRTWNPLTDDGDALRLAVKLGLHVHGREIGGSVEAVQIGYECFYDARGDAYAATRRAIVRAAAEIGRAVPIAGPGTKSEVK